MFRTYDQWKATEPPSGYDTPVEPTAEEERISYLDELQQREDALLEISRVQREHAPCPVDMVKYIGKGKLSMGTWPSAQAAMLASDDAVWINQGDGTYRTQDGKSVIQPVKT